MPYTRKVPRRIKFEPTIVGNITLRQATWAGLGVALGGLTGLGVFTPGLSLPIRLAIATLISFPFFILAFGRSRGLPLDRMLLLWLRWRFSPRLQTWMKGSFQGFLVEQGADLEAPAMEIDTGAAITFALVLVNLLVLIILIGTVLYMWRDGLRDLTPLLRRWR